MFRVLPRCAMERILAAVPPAGKMKGRAASGARRAGLEVGRGSPQTKPAPVLSHAPPSTTMTAPVR